MLDFDFMKRAAPYISIFEEFPLPALLCDRELLVYWSNGIAKMSLPHLTARQGLRAAVAEFGPEAIFGELERYGNYVLEDVLPMTGLSLSFSPVAEGAHVLGAAVLVLGTDWSRPRDAAGHGAAPGALSRGIREGVAQVFTAMDDAYLKALVMDGTFWLSPHLNAINVGVYRVLRVAQNFTAYADLQSGALELRRSPLNVFGWLRDMAPTVETLFREAGIPVRFAVPEGDLLLVLDRDRLELAFFNVVHNCLMYTAEGNAVTIRAEERDGGAEVAVEDRGQGIPAEELSKVFRPFYSEGVAHSSGGGLGLTLARRLTELHGGRFTLSSEPGKGTAAVFYLPAPRFLEGLPLRQEADTGRPDSRFSPIYTGLVGALRRPYEGKQTSGKEDPH